MKAKAVGYWVCTVAIAFPLLSGGILQTIRSPTAIAGMTHLGYPVHFTVLLGIWKILGAIVILLPGFALVKEWAYAGIFIDFTGASVGLAVNRCSETGGCCRWLWLATQPKLTATMSKAAATDTILRLCRA